MTRVPFVDLAAQRAELEPELHRACLTALDRGDYVLGADVEAFEREWAAWCGVRHAIGVDSGTSAVELGLRACGVGRGDEVITAANTFVATVFAIVHAGARPVLVDVDPVTYTLDLARVEEALTARTRAIVPVHLYGQLADVIPLRSLARRRGLVLIEDACQAHGAQEAGRCAGAFGDAAAFSFYPSKNLGAHGDAGMLVTDSAKVAERARLLRNYGQRAKYRSDVVGHNHRLDTLQAAMLRIKLPRLQGWNRARRQHAAAYAAALDGLPLVRPRVRAGVEAVWHLYVIRVTDRDAVREALIAAGIETGIHYPVPVHLQPACRSLGYGPRDFPVTERLALEIVSLPMYPQLPPAAVERVADALRACVSRAPEPVTSLAG
jgi:dTDP-4-amino-4,6-dideoxygalactose transaminase